MFINRCCSSTCSCFLPAWQAFPYERPDSHLLVKLSLGREKKFHGDGIVVGMTSMGRKVPNSFGNACCTIYFRIFPALFCQLLFFSPKHYVKIAYKSFLPNVYSFLCCILRSYRFCLFVCFVCALSSADYADMNRGQLLAKIRELEEVSNKLEIQDVFLSPHHNFIRKSSPFELN